MYKIKKYLRTTWKQIKRTLHIPSKSLKLGKIKQHEDYELNNLVKIDYLTLVDFDNTLAIFLRDSLREFAKNTHSYPEEMLNFEEWQECLNKIADNFDGYTKRPNTTDMNKFTESEEHRKACLNTAMDDLKNIFDRLWM